MDGFLRLQPPGTSVGGLDFQDCFLRWPASLARRRLPGVRHPGALRLGVFLFLLVGLGPSPGRNDRRVGEALRAREPPRPSFRIIDFAGDLALAEESGFRDRLCVVMARAMELLAHMGAHFHTRGGKRWWPTQSIPWRCGGD